MFLLPVNGAGGGLTLTEQIPPFKGGTADTMSNVPPAGGGVSPRPRKRGVNPYEIGESSNVNGGGGSGILISERWGLLSRVDKQRIRTIKPLARVRGWQAEINGEKPGYPRFKGKGRYRSMTYSHLPKKLIVRIKGRVALFQSRHRDSCE